ncbi:2906_t:CDS:2, partial [Entrophospora sp. SA101]
DVNTSGSGMINNELELYNENNASASGMINNELESYNENNASASGMINNELESYNESNININDGGNVSGNVSSYRNMFRDILENARKREEIIHHKSEIIKNEIKNMDKKLKNLKIEVNELEFGKHNHESIKSNLLSSISNLDEEIQYPFTSIVNYYENLEKESKVLEEDFDAKGLKKEDYSLLILALFRKLGIRFFENPNTQKLKVIIGNDDINVAIIDNASDEYEVSNYLWNLVFELEEEERNKHFLIGNPPM